MLGFSHKPNVGLEVTVSGGRSAETIVPLFSQVDVGGKLSWEQLDGLVYRELPNDVPLSILMTMN